MRIYRAETAASTRNARRKGSREISQVILDVSPQIRSPRREDQSNNLAAVMYLRVVFFAVVVALIGAAAATDSGKFATSHR